MNTFICKASKHPSIQRHFQFLYSSHIQLNFCSKSAEVFSLMKGPLQGKGSVPAHMAVKRDWAGLSEGTPRAMISKCFPYMHRHGFIRLFQAVNLCCTHLVVAHAGVNCREIFLGGWSKPWGCVCRGVPCREGQLWGGPAPIWQGCHWPCSANPEQCSRMAARCCWAPAGTKPTVLWSAGWEAFAISAYQM